MFDNADVAIHGGTFTQIAAAKTKDGIEKLVNAANPNAMHNSNARYDPPKCHPGTREAILERIMAWIFGSDDKDALILWLYGPAGAGKSAILQTIAEHCAKLGILLSSFLFCRNDDTRNQPGSLVATIAYQISTRIPQITTALDAAIVRDPMILDKTLDIQIDVLIVGPLRYLVQSKFFADPKSSPRLILIDGLDECNREDHRRAILRGIARSIRLHNLPFIFLVSSRPETDIRFSFDSPDLVNLWNSLVLGDDFRTSQDIQIFLNDSFSSIKERHPMKGYIPPEWPDASVVNTLVTKSSGQFMYASTVIKYISAIRTSPPRQLEVILGVRPARSGDMPFAELDALYTHILSSVEDTELMLDILALLMGYFMRLPPLCRTFDISQFLGVEQEDVDIVFSSLASITTVTHEGEVSISHASLSDVLVDRKRSGRFHIDRTQYAARLAQKGVRWLVSLKSGPPPKNLNLDMHTIFRGVFTSPRPLKMSNDLYQDLQALPLGLIWHDLQEKKKHNRHMITWPGWHFIFNWLLPGGMIYPADTTTQFDSRYQELYIKYSMHLKPLIKVTLSNDMRTKHFLPLMETLAHEFLLNGTRYDGSLSEFLEQQKPWYYGSLLVERHCLPHTICKAIGLSAINAGENAYIHAALRLIKSLTTSRRQHYERIASIRPVTHNDSDLSRLRFSYYQTLTKLIRQPKRDSINSGKIYRIQRDLRLNKLQVGIRDSSVESRYTYAWNRELVLKLLIPVLDQCPKSDELLALINRRIRHVTLRYTPWRHLRDAVYRYIRRTSDVGSTQ